MARDYCAVHYAQWRNSKNGVRTIAKMHPGEWGDWHVGTNGYVTRDRRMPGAKRNEHQSQHRYVMEQHLGRALLTGENVHHINGHRDQNNIENLELWTRAQPAGQRVKDLLAWAEEIIRTYGPLSESGRL